MHRFRSLTGAILVLLSLGGYLFAQQRDSAGLYGRVSDQQGAVVPKAVVTLTHVQTGVVYTTSSNEAGEWQFSTIAVGEYKLKVQKEGFRTEELAGIVLQVNDNRRMDVSLTVGSTATTVTVQAQAVAVDLSGGTLKGTIDNTRALELPLNGRDLADLTSLVPGVQSASGVSGGSGDGAKMAVAARRFSVDGARQDTMSFTLDGGDNMDNLQSTMLPYPFPDAVQEFSVETSGEGAQYGRNNGGRVNVVTKSGTNGFHGDAFEFVRNTAFDANNFFSHGADNLKQNQAGFTFGGPIKKDKLFFFGGYQQTWIRSLSAAGNHLSMSANHREGNFADLCTAGFAAGLCTNSSQQLHDPLNGNAPYTGNVIPKTEWSNAGQALLNYAPVPTGSNGLVYYSTPSLQNAHEWITRGDYNINQKSTFYVRLYRNYQAIPPYMAANNIFTSTEGIIGEDENGTIAFNYTLSPGMLVQTRFTGNDYEGLRSYAFPGTIKTFVPSLNPLGNGVSAGMNGTSGYSISSGNPATFARSNVEFAQNWEWIKGRHSVVWGLNIEDSRYNEWNTYDDPGFGFNGEWTGFDEADYIIGQFNSFTQGNGELEAKRLHYFGFYAGDTFRLTPRLTLNFGARWEPEFPITDVNNRITMYNQAAYNAGTVSTVFVNSPPGLLYVGDKGPSGNTLPAGVIPNNYRHFGPRFGFAYDLFGDGRTSIRGAYGLYYDTPETYEYNNMNDQSPYDFTVNFTSGSFDNPYAGRTSLNVFPYAGDFQKNSAFSLPMVAAALQSSQNLPYEQSWNLTIQRQLRQNWLVSASYVGSKGTHLWGDYDDNPPLYNSALTLAQNLLTENARRPEQQYQELDLLMAGLNQEYNSLQISVERRMSRGLSNKLSYTYSKNMDYESSDEQITSNTLWDPHNFFQFRGPGDFDRRHRFVDSLVYRVPDAGHALHSRFASAIVGNWETSGIVTLQGGTPFTVMSGNSSCACTGKSTAELVGPYGIAHGRHNEIAEYFNTSSFVEPAGGSFGDLARNSIYGPAFLNTDAAAYRNWPLHFLGDQGKLTFRAEFFNLFNRADLSNPTATVGNKNIGKITSTAASPRILQFSMKLFF